MTTIQQLKAFGEEIGLTGSDLANFIKDQQTAEREEREKERIHQKLLAEAQATEAEKERQFQVYKASEAEKERQFELEKLKMETNKEAQTYARDVELERIALQVKKEAMEFDLSKLAAGNRQHDDNNIGVKPGIFGKVPRMPHFDEEHDFMDSYLSRFERFAESQKWKRDDWATYLSALLKGRALDVYARLPVDQANDYDHLKEALLKRYRLSAEGFKMRFRSSKPDTGETPLQFLTRLDNYLQRWIELAKVEQTYEGLKALIVQEQYLSVCSKELALFLKERTPTTIT